MLLTVNEKNRIASTEHWQSFSSTPSEEPKDTFSKDSTPRMSVKASREKKVVQDTVLDEEDVPILPFGKKGALKNI